MKSISDLLGKKRSRRDYAQKIDEKDIERAFFKALKKEMPNICQADVSAFSLRDKKIYCKTGHPAIASEIWRKRERLKKEINDLLEKEIIKEIKVK